nr:hypothetical protein [Tanacetum cinerariifolium]
MPQPMQNLKDSSDLTTTIDMTLALMAKEFTLNNTTPTNNNQRSSSNPSNMQIAQPVQNVWNQVVQNAVQNTAPAEGNGNGINEEEGIQSTQEEFEFMAAADACEETERVKANCILENNLQQASTSGTQSDKAPICDSDRSTEFLKEAAKFVRYFKYLAKEANESLVKNKALEMEIERLLRAVDTTRGTSANTKFAKNSILGKPPSSSRPKLYAITPLPKSMAFPKNSRGKKQKANVSNIENQTKHKAQVWKPKNVGSKERLASPKPTTPRSCLRWSPTGRIFDLKGKIIRTNESVCQSDCSKGDNAFTSNPQEPISRRFPNSTFSMPGGQNWFDTLLISLLSEYKTKDK